MDFQQKYMVRCLELAKLGLRHSMPNPSVGAVIVYEDKIIGEGYSSPFGSHHAEVNAINSVKNKELLSKATLYVSLEPCSHYGKTPPCTNLIIEKKIPSVVIGCQDSHNIVNGTGIKALREAGCKVHLGLLEKECKELNKRFFVFHEKQRPYIILKWAQSLDGFIGQEQQVGKPIAITNEQSNRLVHLWRSEESAIMVGKNTAQCDNPSLTVRHVNGKNPVRMVLDRNLSLSTDLNLFDQTTPTIVFNAKQNKKSQNITYVKIDYSGQVLHQVLQELHAQNLLSVFIEGGAELHNSFIQENLWDEARVFIGEKLLNQGVVAPRLHKEPQNIVSVGNDKLIHYYNV